MSTVELTGFTWRHAGRRAAAVTDVDLRIESGERVLLLGASGAGKSTLLTAMAGLLPDDSGEQTGLVHVDGVDARRGRERVGMVFQDPQTQLVMARTGDDVAFGLENRGVAAELIWPTVRSALSMVTFPYGTDRSTHALSGGEQQRLALAAVIALRPGLLLLDEPTANLDPVAAAAVRAAIRDVLDQSSDTTMVLVEHRVGDSLPLVDRVVVLDTGGGVLADGNPEKVFAEHGEWLARQGVWVPDLAPVPPRRSRAIGERLLHADAVSLAYPGSTTPAVSTMDVELHRGELVAVTGASGSGKSTLARMLGGLIRPDRGAVSADPALSGPGTPLHRWRAATLASRVGSVFQNPEHQFVTSRVIDELNLRPRTAAHDPDRIARRTDELLERLRLTKLAQANPFTLSGGEARRLSVATALASAPEVLVFDEPTFGQDRRTWLELTDLIATLRDEGTAIAVVSHDTDFVAATADRVLTMMDGSLCST
ncbi:energy-coupling factor transport system ATP-binding protein [Stackebrandtia endophytica]|uniref:Energy-coupling factor transport system ATP-binding protein n=1 Tax=Stackebrandtia endophytica TaxID=1496996 RepID=A0A543ASB5_9ACTN|nr:ABC transporter ATP-binding protein [Stackebrandtia endophytica]TQL75472.1 energy-coupling factor transport system ATP-binding protein [Stackebrandtia endophytica]